MSDTQWAGIVAAVLIVVALIHDVIDHPNHYASQGGAIPILTTTQDSPTVTASAALSVPRSRHLRQW